MSRESKKNHSVKWHRPANESHNNSLLADIVRMAARQMAEEMFQHSSNTDRCRKPHSNQSEDET